MATRRNNPPPIYGRKCVVPESVSCDSILADALTALELLTQSILEVVDKFFPGVTATARLIGDMTAAAGMPPIMFVRMVWAENHRGVKFKSTEYEILELIDIYLQFPGLSWRDDYIITKYLKDRGIDPETYVTGTPL